MTFYGSKKPRPSMRMVTSGPKGDAALFGTETVVSNKIQISERVQHPRDSSCTRRWINGKPYLFYRNKFRIMVTRPGPGPDFSIEIVHYFHE